MKCTVYRDIWLVIDAVGTVKVGSYVSVTDKAGEVHAGAVKEIHESGDVVLIVLSTGYVFNPESIQYLRINP